MKNVSVFVFWQIGIILDFLILIVFRMLLRLNFVILFFLFLQVCLSVLIVFFGIVVIVSLMVLIIGLMRFFNRYLLIKNEKGYLKSLIKQSQFLRVFIIFLVILMFVFIWVLIVEVLMCGVRIMLLSFVSGWFVGRGFFLKILRFVFVIQFF